jgi:hypothetical protein
LHDISKVSKSSMLPNSWGICPVKWLCHRFNVLRPFRYPISSGMSPVRQFLERSIEAGLEFQIYLTCQVKFRWRSFVFHARHFTFYPKFMNVKLSCVIICKFDWMNTQLTINTLCKLGVWTN